MGKLFGKNHNTKGGLRKGKLPAPHASPGRAAGAGRTGTSPVSASPMRKPAGLTKSGGVGHGTMTRRPTSPLIGKR